MVLIPAGSFFFWREKGEICLFLFNSFILGTSITASEHYLSDAAFGVLVSGGNIEHCVPCHMISVSV